MTKYYEPTDKSHQIYAAAAFLNPTRRSDSFDNSSVGKLHPGIETFDPIAWRNQPDIEEPFTFSTTLGLRYIRLYSNILRMRASH